MPIVSSCKYTCSSRNSDSVIRAEGMRRALNSMRFGSGARLGFIGMCRALQLDVGHRTAWF